MKRAWPLLAIGAIVYLLVMVITFPASRLAPLLERQVAGLSLHAVTGSVFSGQAAQLIYQDLDFGPLNWQLRPAGLLLGRAGFHLEMTHPANSGAMNMAITPWGTVYVRDLQLTLSPDWLVNRYSPLPVKTSGAMRLQIDAFKLAGGFPEDLTGLLSWDDAVVLDPLEIILGDVGMTLNSQAGLLAADIVEGGRLEAEGGLQLSADGRYHVNLRILPDNEMSDETFATLESLGQIQPDSSLLFETSGQL